MNNYSDTTTNEEPNPSDVETVYPQFKDNKFSWLSSINNYKLFPGFLLLSMTGIPHENEQTYHLNICASPIEVSTETQTVPAFQSIVLPCNYGIFYQKIEQDKSLLEYYKNASFFDDKDFQG